MLSNSNSYFHAAKPGLLYHLKWSWCRMPVTLLVKGPITVSVCLHLPAGKSCRQMNGGFNIRMLSPSSQANPSLPLQCAWAPPIPSSPPGVPASSSRQRHRAPPWRTTSYAPAEDPLPSDREGAKQIGSVLRSLGLCGSEAVTTAKRCVPLSPLNPILCIPGQLQTPL